MLHRKELIFMIFCYNEKDLLNPKSTAIDISSKISILDAANLQTKSQGDVCQTTPKLLLTSKISSSTHRNFNASRSDIVVGDEYKYKALQNGRARGQ